MFPRTVPRGRMSCGLAAENQRIQLGKVAVSKASTLAISARNARVMVTPKRISPRYTSNIKDTSHSAARTDRVIHG